MNVQFSEKATKETDGPEENISIDGRVVGYLKTYVKPEGVTPYHAVFDKIQVSFCLIQGFGATKEAAVVDAIRRARVDATFVLNYADDLENKLKGEAA